MQKAVTFYNNLYQDDSQFKEKIITPTHHYVKITPTSEQDLIALEEIANQNSKIILSKYPLDYKIIQQGSNYLDKSYTGIPEFAPVYTTIPLDYTLNITYEILADLYKPTEDENDIETIAMALAEWKEDLKTDFNADVNIQNVHEFLDGPIGENSQFRRPFNPIGIIAMQVYDTGTLEGLKFAKIKIGRWFWWEETYTNENGFYVSPSNYRGTVSVRSTWRNITATLRMNTTEMLGLDVSDYIMSMDSNNWLFTYVIYNMGADSSIWYKGVVHNGLHKYAQYATNNGVLPVTNANIWVWKTVNGAASTPMFKRFQNAPLVSAYNSWSQPIMWGTLVNSTLGLFSFVTRPLFGHLMPDQIYSELGGNSFKVLGTVFASNRRIEQIVFHECGHFSHALKAGTNNYSKIIAAELKNDQSSGHPYLSGQQPTVELGKQIALAEGWATYMENKCMQNYYGNTFTRNLFSSNTTIVNLPNFMEDYAMYTTPFLQYNLRDNNNWFLSGLMWDISDNVVDNTNSINSQLFNSNGNTLGNIVDNLFLPNPATIYYNLDSTIYNGYDLKIRLMASYPSEAKKIYELFNSYGYE